MPSLQARGVANRKTAIATRGEGGACARPDPRRRAWRRPLLGLAAVVGLAILVLVPIWLDRLIDATELPETRIPTSALMFDRAGRLLRPFPVADGHWRLAPRLDALDPALVAMLLAIEDRRFRDHAGVDPLALVRAAVQWARHGRVVSGGSTLTMQLARLLEGRPTAGLTGKLRQIRIALALERRLDKAAILAAYLTLTPYGGNLEGVRTAALAWFGKEPRRLTAAEAALLVALPQAPEARRPDRDPTAARRARDRILLRAERAGILDAATAAAGRAAPVPTRRQPLPMLAPHLTWRQWRACPDAPERHLTLDAGLQQGLERLAAERAPPLGARVAVAILVADHASGEVLASVGSGDAFDGARRGFVDMTRAVRSPGSTLKPLIYGLAFESGTAHPESLIEDRPSGFAGYAPTNFDRSFQGTVTLRQALQGSLNIPAVRLLDSVGPARLLARLRRAGAAPVLPAGSAPGLAIGLGGVGLTLTDLVALYAAIARGGAPIRLRERLDADTCPPARAGTAAGGSAPVLDARAAWYLASILSGTPAPARAPTGVIAFKTGTSYGYRDAWAIGFDGRHAVGVWAGRADGAAVPGLAGIEASAPILFEAFARLGPRAPLPPPPPGVLIAGTADLPPHLRRVRDPRAPSGAVDRALEIAWPPSGARVELDEGGELVPRARGGTPPFVWYANGAPIGREPFARAIRWIPDDTGFVTLAVVDARGASARVGVFLEWMR